jgi:hypothetical protein
MSSKTQAYILLVLTIVAAMTPTVSLLAGLGLPTAAHVVAALVAIAGALKLSLTASISDSKRIEGAAEVPGATERLAVAIAKKDAAKPPTLPPMPMFMIGLTACSMGLAYAVVIPLIGCAAVPAITVDLVQEIHCVDAQLEAGNDTFEGIAIACGGMLVADVVTIVADEASGEGGVPELAEKARHVHHKVADAGAVGWLDDDFTQRNMTNLVVSLAVSP